MKRYVWDVRIWDGSRLVAVAENIVGGDKYEAARNAFRAISYRRRTPLEGEQLQALRKHLEHPSIYDAPEGFRVQAVKKDPGQVVIG